MNKTKFIRILYKFSDQSKENANLYTETVNEKRAQNSEQKIASVVGKKISAYRFTS